MSTFIAYLDPGSGSQILTILAGGLAAVAVTAKLYWHRVLVFLRLRKPHEESAPDSESRESTQPDAAKRADVA
jgi:hypothetical protein